jgi:hypothetical protein
MPEVEEKDQAVGTDETIPEQAEFQPGELESFDYSVHDFADLTEDEQNELRSLCSQASKRDTAARRMEVEQCWEARLFKRGYQYLLPRYGGGWELPGYASGYGAKQQVNQARLYETNIYGAHCDIITSALVRDIPQCRFYPFNPDYGPDVTAADKAEDFALIFARNNDLRSLHTQIADYLCTDGRVLLYTRMVLDGQRFGFEDEADAEPLVPEDETTGEPQSPNIEEGQETDDEENQSPVKSGRKPRGREITEVLGKLEHKVPINTRDIYGMDFIQAYWDMHIARAKAKFPWKAKEIKPGGNGISEIELDRIARLNSALALPGTYVTGDTFNRDVTLQYNWLRPASFMECKDDNCKARFFELFPDGVLVIFAGSTFIGARNECMDDHLHVIQAFPGSGQNRIALMTKVLSVQKRLNNWIDLLNDFFIRTVPKTWMDTNAFDVEAVQARGNIPGDRGGFQRQPGVPGAELIFVEPTPQHQPELPQFIQFFFTDYPEMLSGALPSLFGAESNTDTVGGISMQRDQALGRLASPWGALQAATAVYHRQGVQQAAICREKLGQSQISESIPGENGPITLEISDLKGNILCYPESDSNFPETWVQRQSRFQQLMTEAGTGNPTILKLLSVPKNMRIAKDAVGLQDLEIPEADSVEKQQGEFEILLKTGPVPNPKLVQAQKQFEQSLQQAQAAGQGAQFAQQAPQVMQAMQGIPPEVSTVQVMQDASEDHETEAETCKEWLNSSEGRKFKNGTPEEKQAWANVHLHWQEHSDMADKLKPPAANKPPSESITAAVDKMPPGVAAQLLEKYYGLPASPKDFAEQDAAELEGKITEKAADFGHGTTAPATPKPSSGKVQ